MFFSAKIKLTFEIVLFFVSFIMIVKPLSSARIGIRLVISKNTEYAKFSLHRCIMGKPRIKMRENPAVTPWAEFLKLVLGKQYVNTCILYTHGHVYTVLYTNYYIYQIM